MPPAGPPTMVRALPTGLLLAGAGAGGLVLAGAGIPAAIVGGGLLLAGRVAVAFARRPQLERIEPFAIQDPWRTFVKRAQSSGRKFDDAVRQTKAGPLRDRLGEVGDRVHTGIREAWVIAQRGHDLDKAVSKLGIQRLRRQLADAETRAGGSATADAVPGDPQETVRALRSSLESAERLAAVAENAEARLRRLNAQLEEAVARAVELSLSASDVAALQPLGSDVEVLVGELESLRQALEETGPR